MDNKKFLFGFDELSDNINILAILTAFSKIEHLLDIYCIQDMYDVIGQGIIAKDNYSVNQDELFRILDIVTSDYYTCEQDALIHAAFRLSLQVIFETAQDIWDNILLKH